MIVRTKVKMQWVQPQTCSCRRSRNSALQNATSYKIACTRLLMRVTITTTNQILWISFFMFLLIFLMLFCCCCCCCRYALFSLQCNAAHADNVCMNACVPNFSYLPWAAWIFASLWIYRVCVFCCFCVLSSLFLFYHHMNDDDNHLRSSLRLFEFFGRKKIVTFCTS